MKIHLYLCSRVFAKFKGIDCTVISKKRIDFEKLLRESDDPKLLKSAEAYFDIDSRTHSDDYDFLICKNDDKFNHIAVFVENTLTYPVFQRLFGKIICSMNLNEYSKAYIFCHKPDNLATVDHIGKIINKTLLRDKLNIFSLALFSDAKGFTIWHGFE